jgi:hypothetical protein
VRVEFVEHASDGILHEFPFVDTVDIKIADGYLGKLQFAERRVFTVVDPELRIGERREQQQG